MKISKILFFVFGCLMSLSVTAQYNLISKELEVSVYPSEGQSKSTQKYDEKECYDWAYDQLGQSDIRFLRNRNYNKPPAIRVACFFNNQNSRISQREIRLINPTRERGERNGE